MPTVKEVYEKYSYPRRWIERTEDLQAYVQWFKRASGIENVNGLNVLEIGCGTGELANGLALEGAHVTALDLSLNSLKHALELQEKFGIKNVQWVNGDVMDLPLTKLGEFKNEKLENANLKRVKKLPFGKNKNYAGKKFDLVIALGCLHYTGQTRKAFEGLVDCVAENGFYCVGLYNKIARVRMRVKRAIVQGIAGRNASTEKRMQFGKKLFGTGYTVMNEQTWLADKYAVPVETYHSVKEVINWFKGENFKITQIRPEVSNVTWLSELNWLVQKKGAFFIVTGQKTK